MKLKSAWLAAHRQTKLFRWDTANKSVIQWKMRQFSKFDQYFLCFTIFACLITKIIWPNLACWWILSIWANWANSDTFCILCRLTVSAVCNFFISTVSLLVLLFNYFSYLSWLCFLSDETLTLASLIISVTWPLNHWSYIVQLNW